MRITFATDSQWYTVGKKIKAQLPPHEFEPFIAWLNNHPDMVAAYIKAPGAALRMWNESIERYLLEDDPALQVSEGL